MARPRIPRLSPERIADAALALIDECGSFQVLGIAERLGVAPSSLYNHVRGRDEVIELIRDRIGGGFVSPAIEQGDWQAAVRDMLAALVVVYAKHPRAVPLLFEQSIHSARTLKDYDDLARVLLDAGFPADSLVAIISMLDAHALGLAVDLTVPDPLWVFQDDEATPALRRALEVGSPPQRARTVQELSADVIVDGLKALLARQSSES